jgi:hypothetical protein
VIISIVLDMIVNFVADMENVIVEYVNVNLDILDVHVNAQQVQIAV